MLVNRSMTSLWRSMFDGRSSLSSSSSPPPAFLAPHPLTYNGRNEDDDEDDDSNGDYADVLSPEYEIDRKQIQMVDSLGNGQFGEVYRGILKVRFDYFIGILLVCLLFIQTDQQLEINIAIKTCKMQDTATTEAFLDEACKTYDSELFKYPIFL